MFGKADHTWAVEPPLTPRISDGFLQGSCSLPKLACNLPASLGAHPGCSADRDHFLDTRILSVVLHGCAVLAEGDSAPCQVIRRGRMVTY